MGTNFYLMTKSKELAQEYAPYEYAVVDEPYFGYEIHIAKTSSGWKPAFEAHDGSTPDTGIKSVADIKRAYDAGFEIYDEYNTKYDWEPFKEQVLDFNRNNDKALDLFTYERGCYVQSCRAYRDREGYEFQFGDFC